MAPNQAYRLFISFDLQVEIPDLLDLRVFIHKFRYLAHEIVDCLLIFWSCSAEGLIISLILRSGIEAYGHAKLCDPEWFTKFPEPFDYILDTL